MTAAPAKHHPSRLASEPQPLSGSEVAGGVARVYGTRTRRQCLFSRQRFHPHNNDQKNRRGILRGLQWGISLWEASADKETEFAAELSGAEGRVGQ